MKTQRALIKVAIATGICGLGTPAIADTPVLTRHPVVEYRAVNGASTAGSFAAASVMGQKGWDDSVPTGSWETNIINACTSTTAALPQADRNTVSGSSLWPSACNPKGMAQALNANPGTSWIKVMYAGTDGTVSDPGRISAFSEILHAFQTYHSPVILPLYGQADHWATIVQVNLWDVAGTGHNIGDLKTVKYYDGGPPSTDTFDSIDSSGNSYPPAGQLPISYAASTFGNAYFKMLTAINPSCDPNCTTDPYFHQYVLLYEPPGGHVAPSQIAVVSAPPGLTGPHRNLMTPQLAQSGVFQALRLGGIDTDPATWTAIAGGTPGAAFEVHGVFPSGAPWDYYLVPLLDASRKVIAFVQLSTDDGSFQALYPLPAPITFDAVSAAKAQDLARRFLAKGESLRPGVLTWDPRTITPFAKSPTRPYYELSVMAGGKTVGTVRVALDGTAIRE